MSTKPLHWGSWKNEVELCVGTAQYREVCPYVWTFLAALGVEMGMEYVSLLTALRLFTSLPGLRGPQQRDS